MSGRKKEDDWESRDDGPFDSLPIEIADVAKLLKFKTVDEIVLDIICFYKMGTSGSWTSDFHELLTKVHGSNSHGLSPCTKLLIFACLINRQYLERWLYHVEYVGNVMIVPEYKRYFLNYLNRDIYTAVGEHNFKKVLAKKCVYLNCMNAPNTNMIFQLQQWQERWRTQEFKFLKKLKLKELAILESHTAVETKIFYSILGVMEFTGGNLEAFVYDVFFDFLLLKGDIRYENYVSTDYEIEDLQNNKRGELDERSIPDDSQNKSKKGKKRSRHERSRSKRRKRSRSRDRDRRSRSRNRSRSMERRRSRSHDERRRSRSRDERRRSRDRRRSRSRHERSKSRDKRRSRSRDKRRSRSRDEKRSLSRDRSDDGHSKRDCYRPKPITTRKDKSEEFKRKKELLDGLKEEPYFELLKNYKEALFIPKGESLNYKGYLLQLATSRYKCKVKFSLDDKADEFSTVKQWEAVARVEISGKLYVGKGEGPNKKTAEQKASLEILLLMDDDNLTLAQTK